MRVVAAMAGLLAVVGVAGCFLVTGSTTGYTSAAEGGTLAGQSCETPADCPGSVCCIVLSDAGALPSTTCQAACTDPYAQLCGVASDCGEGGSCLVQSCTVDDVAVQVTSCGPIPVCTQ